ncbi:hypothetical protein F4859DRAFT_495965 [Xylaria cf. heliscus]|nr:hypothetical protein F4859DRAFT_495965 [Xylaria cf. heliscus]
MSSFFNKLASKLDDLDLGGKDDDRPKNRDYPPPSHGYGGGPPQSYGYSGQHQQSYDGPPPPERYHQQSYGGPPPPEGYRQQPYGSGPPPPEGYRQDSYGGPPRPDGYHGQSYGSPPPPQSGGYPSQYQQRDYGSPAPPSQDPVYTHPDGKPPLPHGWIPQWDRQYQRWYYAEEATGRTQWEAPGGRSSENRGWGGPSGDYSQPPHGTPGYEGYSHGPGHDSGHDPSHDTRGYDAHGSSGYPPYPGYGSPPPAEKPKKDKTLLYAAGGLAAGAIGGALIANALHDSDSENEHHSAPPPQQYTAPAPAPYEAPGPAYEPAYNADGEYVDASDRESVASARERYEEAQREAADSDASSSEQEELEEAREEYYEEYEEAYED